MSSNERGTPFLPSPFSGDPKPRARIFHGALDHHATALGYLCFEHALLDLRSLEALTTFLGCSQDAGRAIMMACGQTLRGKFELVKSLASLNPVDQDWYECLESWISHSNKISEVRNRLIHDVWGPGGGAVIQYDIRALLRKEKSRSPKQIKKITKDARDLDDIWELIREIKETNLHLGDLILEWSEWRKGNTQPFLKRVRPEE